MEFEQTPDQSTETTKETEISRELRQQTLAREDLMKAILKLEKRLTKILRQRPTKEASPEPEAKKPSGFSTELGRAIRVGRREIEDCIIAVKDMDKRIEL
jgi:hypothetical protein